MKRPPVWVRLAFGRGRLLHLPLVLLWPLVLIAALLALPLVVLLFVAAVLHPDRPRLWRAMVLVPGRVLSVLCSLPGLKLERVTSAGRQLIEIR